MSQVEELGDIPSLIDVQLAFEHWRNTRDIRTATPLRLRELAAGLVSRYRQSQICEALGISSTALKLWSGSSTVCKDDNESPTFVTLPIPDKLETHNDYCHLTLQLPNGIEIRAQGHYTLSQLLSAASTLGVNA